MISENSLQLQINQQHLNLLISSEETEIEVTEVTEIEEIEVTEGTEVTEEIEIGIDQRRNTMTAMLTTELDS